MRARTDGARVIESRRPQLIWVLCRQTELRTTRPGTALQVRRWSNGAGEPVRQARPRAEAKLASRELEPDDSAATWCGTPPALGRVGRRRRATLPPPMPPRRSPSSPVTSELDGYQSQHVPCVVVLKERALLPEDGRHNNQMQLTGGEGGAHGTMERASSRVAARS
jgi:hypothetical protein